MIAKTPPSPVLNTQVLPPPIILTSSPSTGAPITEEELVQAQKIWGGWSR